MSKLNELIENFCPEGVEYKFLGEICEIKTGKGITKNQGHEDAKYPIISGGKEPMGYYDIFNRLEYTVTISRVGANAGYVNFIQTKFYLNDKCFSIIPLEIYQSNIKSKFLFYYLKTTECDITGLQSEGGVPTINTAKVSSISIPIPPLPIQEEIVKILDKFTLLEAELEAELEARKKQYEHYRDRLLSFEGKKVEWETLGEVCQLKAGKSITAFEISTIKNEEHLFPCIGGNGSRGFVKSYSHSGEFPIIGRQGALCGNIYFAKGNFYATEHAVVVSSGEKLIPRFLYYLLITLNLNQYATGGAQPGLSVSKLVSIKIPIPTVSDQEKIANILDKFDALVNDISVGLPAEIAARKKQYEYYRNRLLTFKPINE